MEWQLLSAIMLSTLLTTNSLQKEFRYFTRLKWLNVLNREHIMRTLSMCHNNFYESTLCHHIKYFTFIVLPQGPL